jgi:hypothetical protein
VEPETSADLLREMARVMRRVAHGSLPRASLSCVESTPPAHSAMKRPSARR